MQKVALRIVERATSSKNVQIQLGGKRSERTSVPQRCGKEMENISNLHCKRRLGGALNGTKQTFDSGV